MIKKIILALTGYKLIDQMSGLWRHSYRGMEKKEIVFADYSRYDIFYNEKKNHYKMIAYGYKPFVHFLNSELGMILETVNLKLGDGLINYTDTTQDYFFHKEQLLDYINTGVGEVTLDHPSQLLIIKFELDQSKEYVLSFQDQNKKMIELINNFKNTTLLPDGVEIFEQHDNILITSEGFYVCTAKEKLNMTDNGRTEENSNEEED